ncbi:Oxygen regulatory protein NreC [Pontiella desulfatans]|uniref:Oxygen regulatory protein NreC n=1 Tax=Pontiella desulfatans TaxID=2750659 RepID=A0A6C2TZT6_PONDE|nr:response regulator transcription factor [Pontiella desulfatans]VGO13182.1 Oxygen regulatory protein NreC [Pontiella desulfatans]
MKRKIKIMLVEDNPEYRDVIDFAIEHEEEMELINQFGLAERALQSFQSMETRTEPDIILLDLNLPGISGLEALPHLIKAAPNSSIIILTQSDQEADVLRAIAEGARGYLLKSATVQQIKDGIRTVAQGGSTLDSKVARFMMDTLKNKLPNLNAENLLSDRELETLLLMGEGLARKEIAQKLKISVYTVDTHIRHIYDKFNVPNSAAAVHCAHRLGLFHRDN